jgi:hypothetical protein
MNAIPFLTLLAIVSLWAAVKVAIIEACDALGAVHGADVHRGRDAILGGDDQEIEATDKRVQSCLPGDLKQAESPTSNSVNGSCSIITLGLTLTTRRSQHSRVVSSRKSAQDESTSNF